MKALQILTWEDVTVKQFQQIASIPGILSADVRDIYRVGVFAKAGEILFDATEDEENQLDYSELKKCLSFLDAAEVPVIFKRHLDINGRRYRFLYDIRDAKMIVADIEPNAFDMIPQTVAAVMTPQRRYCRRWLDCRYNMGDYSTYLSDIQAAKITDVYGVYVFWISVLNDTITSLGDIFTEELTKKGIAKEEITKVFSETKEALKTEDQTA